MTTPSEYRNLSIPVKRFLNSYRALSDGKSGIRQLERHLNSTEYLISEWKVLWIGTCTILRTSIDLFQVDKKSCINSKIREEISQEWKMIKENKKEHTIFWDFLRKERNNVIHQYEWIAYEAWMKDDGTIEPQPLSLLSIKPEDAKSSLIIRSGTFEGRDSLELLDESANWVTERIFNAIRRAGFDPEEERTLGTFKVPEKPKPTLITSGLLADGNLPSDD